MARCKVLPNTWQFSEGKTGLLWCHCQVRGTICQTWWHRIHIDHATPNYFDFIVYCIENNLVTSVMIDASKEQLAENIRITKEVVDVAHKHSILVEGEIGHIKGTEDEIVSDTELYTHPEEALEFVIKTNVDLFAASVGTNHGVSKGENIVLRLDLVKEIDDLLIKNHVHGS